MRLTVLGSGTHIAHPDRGPSGLLLQRAGRSILVDGGSGSLQRLARAGVNPAWLDAGVYTHRHLDHCADLAPLLFSMRQEKDPPRRHDYPIYAGAGFKEHLAGLLALYGSSIAPVRFRAPVVELPLDGPGQAELPGGLRLDSLPANHEQGALHLRFATPEGRTITISGDSGPSDDLEDLAAGTDLLVCECALPPKETYAGHMNADDVARLVAAARPRQVILVHLYPRPDPQADLRRIASTGVPVLRARDGQRFDLT